MDERLDDDDNLAKWEDNTLTASDRRILPPRELVLQGVQEGAGGRGQDEVLPARRCPPHRRRLGRRSHQARGCAARIQNPNLDRETV